ncbi:hypothetical protein F3Y22_tig00008013pilonHSYRG00086 [Hibiscus syriacus]|uniref:non-specific serine/threonine protein kinase n=1 Tax=Hibiscus syriacus TaxID=106335 RepID=A0A6A3CAV8_HIBSY|nr:hypothetical protein F3Y22_tig00008013pilonHSYRG00086 [Hibiscus syriacus]
MKLPIYPSWHAYMRLFFILLLNFVSAYHHHHSLRQDKAALLAFKKSIHDPASSLANWKDEVHVCNFTGIVCNKHRHHRRVIEIALSSSRLVGKIPPLLSNITGLRSLKLDDNQFYGTVPPQISSLRHLTVFIVWNNNLTGTLPPSLFSNCTKLSIIDASLNYFTGQIPTQIGNCQRLWSFNSYDNFFTGRLPVSLANTTILSHLDVGYNLLSGELPSELVRNWPNLESLYLSNNNMKSHGNNTNLYPFFAALRNCTHLKEVALVGMGLGGRLPSSIAHPALNFLDLRINRIFGSIPPEIGNLRNISELHLTSNLLNGTIPEQISLLSMLEQLFLSNNFFSGRVPITLRKLGHLGLIDLSNNKLSGEIPADFGDLAQLRYLFLNNNLLSGSIPLKLLNCKNLIKLDLSYNQLTGRIPTQIAELREIRISINLSHNHLQGPLPLELSKLANVLEMDLSSNNLSGNIFPQISSCFAVTMINFSHNSLQGQLPDSLGDLRNLQVIDVSSNNISGKIPMSLSKINLTFLNLSFNNFNGMIPSGGIFDSTTNMSFLGNPLLCGVASSVPICPHKEHWFRSRVVLIIFITVIVVSVLLSIVCCMIGIRRIKLMVSSRKTERSRKTAAPKITQNFPRLTYKELSYATGGFDEHKLIGTGSYGRVYKGVLPDETIIAVKVLHLQSGNSIKSFNRECQVLKRIRHRNLIRIITACSTSDLTLIQRVSICSDIAEGMAYLHHHSPVRVIHCDLKPSNVLLNDDMTALVSDFGIARLVMTVGAENGGGGGAIENMGNSTANMLTGSIGYIAPEYGFGSNTSIRGDVYSFGIVVLEMVTRKRPTDDMFVGGLNLQRWVKNHYRERLEKVVDSCLIRASRDQPAGVKRMWEVAVGELIELGILCTQETPSNRPTMLDAADDLDRLKRYLNGDTTLTFASSLEISSSTLSID